MVAKAYVALGAGLLVVGVWLFIFPFVAPSVGMPLAAASTTPASSTSSHTMAGMKSSSGTMAGMKSSSGSMAGMKSSGAVTAAKGSSASKPRSVTVSSAAPARSIVVNHAAVVTNLIPGVLVAMVGVYLLVSAFDRQRRIETAGV